VTSNEPEPPTRRRLIAKLKKWIRHPWTFKAAVLLLKLIDVALKVYKLLS
jgi:hypothetical protein